jgi:hypothetical protein
LPTLKQPPAHIPYAKAYPSGVLDVLIVGAGFSSHWHGNGLMGLWVGTLLIAIIYAIKAGRGEWADYPVIGKLARKILKMDPVEGRLAPMPQM